MRKGFEVNGDYRLMDSSELVYILTNNAVMVNKVQEKEVVYGEECSFEDVLAKMTPRNNPHFHSTSILPHIAGFSHSDKPKILSSALLCHQKKYLPATENHPIHLSSL